MQPPAQVPDSIFKQPRPSLRANGSRECAPDDRLRKAIHKVAKKDGLLRRFAPRNDGESTYDFALAARCARAVHLIFRPKRAQGTPGARCTRSPLCNVEST